MENPGTASGEPGGKEAPSPTLHLTILSPSGEVPQGFSYPALPASTTVGELKRKLQTELATRPGLSRQRLIHRGRVLSDDTHTLFEVFGQQAVSYSVSFRSTDR